MELAHVFLKLNRAERVLKNLKKPFPLLEDFLTYIRLKY